MQFFCKETYTSTQNRYNWMFFSWKTHNIYFSSFLSIEDVKIDFHIRDKSVSVEHTLKHFFSLFFQVRIHFLFHLLIWINTTSYKKRPMLLIQIQFTTTAFWWIYLHSWSNLSTFYFSCTLVAKTTKHHIERNWVTRSMPLLSIVIKLLILSSCLVIAL